MPKHEGSVPSQQHAREVRVAPPVFAGPDSHALRSMLVQKQIYPLYEGVTKSWDMLHQVVGSVLNERAQNRHARLQRQEQTSSFKSRKSTCIMLCLDALRIFEPREIVLVVCMQPNVRARITSQQGPGERLTFVVALLEIFAVSLCGYPLWTPLPC